MIERRYPSKVLLFGEYTVLHGGTALALPYHGFWGQAGHNVHRSIEDWQPLLSFLEKINNRLAYRLDLSRLNREIQMGLEFISNIPIGHGVGSSAALCAFLYENFSEHPLNYNLTALMADLAEIESFFHGKSSGFDPLISLLGKPLKYGSTGPEFVDIPSFEKLHLYLVGPSKSRTSGPLVSSYKKMLRVKNFTSDMDDLADLTDQIIEIFLTGDHGSLWPMLKKLSLAQSNNLNFLIPPYHEKKWKRLSEEGNFIIKLCGAGGGGFLLAFGEDDLSDKEFLKVF